MNKEQLFSMSKEDMKKEFSKIKPLIPNDACNNCDNCSNCNICNNCYNCDYCNICDYCVYCVSQKNKAYMILNIQLTKEEYWNKVKELGL